jgi:hypothetical protein
MFIRTSGLIFGIIVTVRNEKYPCFVWEWNLCQFMGRKWTESVREQVAEEDIQH